MILIFAIQLRQNSTFYTEPDFLNPPSSNDRYLPALLGILRAELVSIQSGTGAAPERGFFFICLFLSARGPRGHGSGSIPVWLPPGRLFKMTQKVNVTILCFLFQNNKNSLANKDFLSFSTLTCIYSRR